MKPPLSRGELARRLGDQGSFPGVRRIPASRQPPPYRFGTARDGTRPRWRRRPGGGTGVDVTAVIDAARTARNTLQAEPGRPRSLTSFLLATCVRPHFVGPVTGSATLKSDVLEDTIAADRLYRTRRL